MRRRLMAKLGGLMALTLFAAQARAAEPRHFSFGYDQPHTTGFGVAGCFRAPDGLRYICP